MAEIHHTIKSIGKSFTFREWIKWNEENRANGGHTRVVYECNGYEFNDCDVCLNPDTIKVYEHTTIMVAEMEKGKWVEGVYCLHYTSPCCWSELNYSSRDKAIEAALQRIIDHYESDIKWFADNSNYTSDKRWAQGAIEAVRQELGKRKFKQLTLF